jgi:hypothetical protein
MHDTSLRRAERYSPKNAWHGFANSDHELLLLWIMAPAGLDGFFRDTCNPPGAPPKQLTREQVNEIARRRNTDNQASQYPVTGCAHSDDRVRSVIL